MTNSMPKMMRAATDENGFVLVAVMLMLLILAFIGITSTTTSNIEMQIAGNDKIYKQNFYEADSAAAIVGSHLVEENMACWRTNDGFANNVAADTADTPVVQTGSSIVNGQFVVERTSAADLTPTKFWTNDVIPTTISDADRDAYFPQNYGNGPHTNLRIGGGWTNPVDGAPVPMVSGYDEAVDKGYRILFTIISQSYGLQNSKSEVEIIWHHQMGLEGECNY